MSALALLGAVTLYVGVVWFLGCFCALSDLWEEAGRSPSGGLGRKGKGRLSGAAAHAAEASPSSPRLEARWRKLTEDLFLPPFRQTGLHSAFVPLSRFAAGDALELAAASTRVRLGPEDEDDPLGDGDLVDDIQQEQERREQERDDDERPEIGWF